MTSFVLKLIGIITMLCDHTKDAVLTNTTFLNYIGRFAFPIFAFQLVVGYTHTKDIKKYLIRLLIFALISQIPFMLFLSTFTNEISLNVFFTFLLGILALLAYDNISNKFLGIGAVLGISLIAQILKVDYGAFGILLIFLFYYFKDKKFEVIIPYILLCFLKYVPNIIEHPDFYSIYLNLATFTALPIILISFYNNKQGPKMKYLFYIFYPLHLVILWAIHTFFGQ